MLDPHAKLAAKSQCIVLYGPSEATVENVHLGGCFRGIRIQYPVALVAGAKDVVVQNVRKNPGSGADSKHRAWTCIILCCTPQIIKKCLNAYI